MKFSFPAHLKHRNFSISGCSQAHGRLSAKKEKKKPLF